MNRTLNNPYYLFSFQHVMSRQRYSFLPQILSSNTRYDKVRFVEGLPVNLTATTPTISFDYLGEYYYSIYEQTSPSNTNINLTHDKLESGRAWVIVDNDNTLDCLYEPYISTNETNENYIFISEEEEQCIVPSTPTPTPSITASPTVTPSITPTQTGTPTQTPTNTPTPSVTPSYTPSPTPTFTPTPSQTPPTAVDPNTLNALWWVDYTSSSYLSLVGGSNIAGATNRTGNPSFSANTGNEPGWFSNAYNGVSGATGTGNRITSLLGNYNTSISAYTTFFHFSAGTGANAILIQSDFTTDYSGNTQGYRWFSIDDYGGGDFVRTYSFYTNGLSSNPEPQYTFTPNTWTKGATRVYQSGTSGVTEFWVNGTLQSQTVQSSVTIRTSTNPIFQLGGNGGINFKISEAFFFDYSLSDGQMGTMFNYLTNKYV